MGGSPRAKDVSTVIFPTTDWGLLRIVKNSCFGDITGHCPASWVQMARFGTKNRSNLNRKPTRGLVAHFQCVVTHVQPTKKGKKAFLWQDQVKRLYSLQRAECKLQQADHQLSANGGAPCAVRALCKKSAVFHHR